MVNNDVTPTSSHSPQFNSRSNWVKNVRGEWVKTDEASINSDKVSFSMARQGKYNQNAMDKRLEAIIKEIQISTLKTKVIHQLFTTRRRMSSSIASMLSIITGIVRYHRLVKN